MLDTLTPAADQKLEIVPRRLELAFGDGDGSLVRLSLPPVEEILAIKGLPAQQISVNQVADDAKQVFQGMFADEALRLESKETQFGDSATFLCRLASLKEQAGDLRDAERYLERAVKLADSPFTHLKLGTNLFRQKRLSDAKASYSSERLANTVDGALRLALVAIIERDFAGANHYVERALNIDALDYRAHLFAGTLSLARSQFQIAVRHLRVAAEENPSSAVVLVNLAVAHVCSGHPIKALRLLRTAVRLNPVSTNALAFLADLTFSQGVSKEAIGPLELFVKYEQKMPSMWARLARAYYATGQRDRALRALRHEASLRDSVGVWNNIAVCSLESGDTSKAVQALKYALTQKEAPGETAKDTALLNLLGALAVVGNHEEVFRISEDAIVGDGSRKYSSNARLCAVWEHNLISLRRMRREEEFLVRAERLLIDSSVTPLLRDSLLANVIHHFTMIAKPDLGSATKYADTVYGLLSRGEETPTRGKLMAINNAAYTYIASGDLGRAEELIKQLNHLIHVDPTPTATLGFLHFAKGHIERGIELYEDAIRLLKDTQTRRRFGQKLNLEIGRHFVKSGNRSEAQKYLTLALQVRDGIPAFLSEAQALAAQLQS